MSTNVELTSCLACGHQMLAAMLEVMMLKIMLAMMIKTWAIVARLRSFNPHLEFCILIYMHSHESEGVAFTFLHMLSASGSWAALKLLKKMSLTKSRRLGKYGRSRKLRLLCRNGSIAEFASGDHVQLVLLPVLVLVFSTWCFRCWA